MTLYGTWLKPLLFSQDPESIHHRSMAGLCMGLGCGPIRNLVAMRQRVEHPALSISLPIAPDKAAMSLRFPGAVGLAAGFDKDAHAIEPLAALGFSHVEVGTVTGAGQMGNPKPRSFRLRRDRAIINRMGFNNGGCAQMAKRLGAAYDHVGGVRRPPCPLGINLGKTKVVELDKALDDYLSSVNALAPFADYLVVNVSSPNTPGLRDLQSEVALRPLLAGISAELERVAPGTPLFLKIAPDLSPEGVDAAVDVALEEGCHGFICTNTTISRPKLATPWLRVDGIGAGGLSGAPIKALSTAILARVARRTQGKVPLIGVGGIENADDAFEKIAHGAHLVQIYTGFVYGGPGVVRRIHHGLLGLLQRNGLSHLSQAVGRDL